MSQKVDDEETIPLCRKHHGHLHDGKGVFRWAKKTDRRQWQEEAMLQYKPWDDVF
jgi:hypothetical protein